MSHYYSSVYDSVVPETAGRENKLDKTCADPGIFVGGGGGGGGGGGPGQSDKKSSDVNVFFFFFFFFFLVLSLFYRSQMVNLKEIYHFTRFQRGSNIFQGGRDPIFSRGGSNCLFPIETHITCDFPGGGGPDPCPPPSGSTLAKGQKPK